MKQRNIFIMKQEIKKLILNWLLCYGFGIASIICLVFIGGVYILIFAAAVNVAAAYLFFGLHLSTTNIHIDLFLVITEGLLEILLLLLVLTLFITSKIFLDKSSSIKLNKYVKFVSAYFWLPFVMFYFGYLIHNNSFSNPNIEGREYIWIFRVLGIIATVGGYFVFLRNKKMIYKVH